MNTCCYSKIRYFHNWMIDYEFDKNENKNKMEMLSKIITKILTNLSLNQEFEDMSTKTLDMYTIYTGYSGIAYMFYHLSQIGELVVSRQSNLQNALNFISFTLNQLNLFPNSITAHHPGLLLGYGGVYVIAAAIYHKIGDQFESLRYQKMFTDLADLCKLTDFTNGVGSDELFIGRAGYILGSLWLANETKTPLKLRDLHDICRIMVQSGRDTSKRLASPSPLAYFYHDDHYIGAAHGLSTILFALISVPGFLDLNANDANDIRRTIDYLLYIQFKDGNFPASMSTLSSSSSGLDDLMHWCHGVPGMIYLFAKAYLIWHDERYLKVCKRGSDLIWTRGLLKKGSSLCHGIAGNGYQFLLMYQLTDDFMYYKRAKCFEYFTETKEFINSAKVSDHPYSLFEGIAGLACFIADNLQPKSAQFPFMNVFL